MTPAGILNLSALGDLAGQAAAVQSELNAAAASEREAAHALLVAVFRRASPGLRSICARPKLARHGDHSERAGWRGVCIAGDDEPVREGRRDDHRGGIAGNGLWLRPDLTLAELSYSGSWGRWQGEEWDATVVAEYADVSAALAGGWELDPVAVALTLSNAFQRVAEGKGAERARMLAARAERLAAVAALV